MEDAEDLAITLERKTRIATARLTAITPITVDVPPPIPMQPLLPPWAPYVGAALGALCLLAATTGIALGHRTEAPAPRAGHVAVVLEANEEITYQPISTPDKPLPLEDAPPPPAPIHHRRKASGGFFGHLGSDRRR